MLLGEDTLIELNVTIKNKFYADSSSAVLAEIDFSVESGEFVTLIGPSGCGKTTLLNMISGLEKSTAQEISCNKSRNKSSQGHYLGYIFQQPRLMPWLTVRKNIELVLQPEQYHQISSLLLKVGLADKGEYFPRQLSGGMQRRVSIARAFAINPKLLLLDAPFNSLDAPTAQRLRELLMDLCRQKGTTVVFVTHDLPEAILLSDRIIFMSNSPSSIIHQTIVDLPRPRKESGIAELAWQAKLMAQFPDLLAGRINSILE